MTRLPRDVRRPVALVTGASSGIGLELSRELASHGHDLVLVSRSAEKLERIARDLSGEFNVRAVSRPEDLSNDGRAEILWRDLADQGVAVDVLVNNAGIGLHGAVADQNLDAIQRLITLNVTALATLTRLAIPGMIAQRRGRILNVASVVAFQPGGPQEAAYYATKSFVLSFSRSLALELRGGGVTVTALCPGPTKTSFDATAGAAGSALYRWVPAMSAAAVARAGYRGMMRGSEVVIPGAIAKLMALAGALPPRRIALEVNRLLLQSVAKSG